MPNDEIENGKEIKAPEYLPVPVPKGTERVAVYNPLEVRPWDELIRAGEIHIFRAIDEELKDEVVKAIHWLQHKSRKALQVYISSPGGEVGEGLAIFDVIRAYPYPTMTIGMGFVSSMASILLQAGQTRAMYPTSWLMIHEISSFIEGKTSAAEDEISHNKRLQAQFLDIFAGRSKMSRKKIEENWRRRDWWLNSAEALKHGFIDEIISPKRKKVPNERA